MKLYEALYLKDLALAEGKSARNYLFIFCSHRSDIPFGLGQTIYTIMIERDR